jgi:hypothetical protein
MKRLISSYQVGYVFFRHHLFPSSMDVVDEGAITIERSWRGSIFLLSFEQRRWFLRETSAELFNAFEEGSTSVLWHKSRSGEAEMKDADMTWAYHNMPQTIEGRHVQAVWGTRQLLKRLTCCP